MNFFREVVRRDVYLEETIKCNVRMDSDDNLNLGLLGRFSVTKIYKSQMNIMDYFQIYECYEKT